MINFSPRVTAPAGALPYGFACQTFRSGALAFSITCDVSNWRAWLFSAAATLLVRASQGQSAVPQNSRCGSCGSRQIALLLRSEMGDYHSIFAFKSSSVVLREPVVGSVVAWSHPQRAYGEVRAM